MITPSCTHNVILSLPTLSSRLLPRLVSSTSTLARSSVPLLRLSLRLSSSFSSRGFATKIPGLEPAHAVCILPTSNRVETSPVLVGLTDLLERSQLVLGYFRLFAPIADVTKKKDQDREKAEIIQREDQQQRQQQMPYDDREPGAPAAVASGRHTFDRYTRPSEEDTHREYDPYFIQQSPKGFPNPYHIQRQDPYYGVSSSMAPRRAIYPSQDMPMGMGMYPGVPDLEEQLEMMRRMEPYHIPLMSRLTDVQPGIGMDLATAEKLLHRGDRDALIEHIVISYRKFRENALKSAMQQRAAKLRGMGSPAAPSERSALAAASSPFVDSELQLQDSDLFVIVESSFIKGHSDIVHYELNADISKMIEAPLLLVATSQGKAEQQDSRTAEVEDLAYNIQQKERKERTEKEKDDAFMIASSFTDALPVLRKKNADILACIYNRSYGGDEFSMELKEEFARQQSQRFPNHPPVPFAGTIPNDRQLQVWRMTDVLRSLNQPQVLCGEEFLDNQVDEKNVLVATLQFNTLLKSIRQHPGKLLKDYKNEIIDQMKLRAAIRARERGGGPLDRISREEFRKILMHYNDISLHVPLKAIEALINDIDSNNDGSIEFTEFRDYVPSILLVVAIDRLDVIAGVLFADLSRQFVGAVSGMIVTGMGDSGPLLELLQGLQVSGRRVIPLMPVIRTPDATYETVRRLLGTRSHIAFSGERKMERCRLLFQKNIDLDMLNRAFAQPRESILTPKMFQHNYLKKAKDGQRTIVLPEGGESRVIIAAAEVMRKQLAQLVLLGNETEIREKAKKLHVDLGGVRIIDHRLDTNREKYVKLLVEKRKSKGITEENAKDLLTDVNYYGTLMVESGDADGMVSGSIHTTAATVRPALQIIKTKPGINIVSSAFFMCLDREVLVYADCAINTDPNAKELSQIAITTAETAEMFGISPRVAMLSYATGDSNEGPMIAKVREATALAKKARPDLPIYGPIQYDAAVDPSIAKTKVKEENFGVAGRANVLIFPDLNTGNNTYKAVQQSTGAIAVGPVLQGLNKPVNDLSRGATVTDIVNTIAITANMVEEKTEAAQKEATQK